MPEQNPTVEIDGLAYVDITPSVTRLRAKKGYGPDTTVLEFGTESNAAAVGALTLPHAAWVQVIPLLIETLPEPFQAQAIAAVAKVGGAAVSA